MVHPPKQPQFTQFGLRYMSNTSTPATHIGMNCPNLVDIIVKDCISNGICPNSPEFQSQFHNPEPNSRKYTIPILIPIRSMNKQLKKKRSPKIFNNQSSTQKLQIETPEKKLEVRVLF